MIDVAKGTPKGRCERLVVTTGDGRVFDLGRPDARLFRLRLAFYKFKRRGELRETR